MSTGQAARVYAAALFEAAGEAGSVEPTRTDLHAFAEALAASPALADVMYNPQVDAAAKQRVLGALTRDADRLAAGVLGVLLQKGRIALAPDVVVEYDRFAAEQARVVDVELTTAVAVDAACEREIVARVEKTTGRTARLETRVDPGIVGGLVLRVGDKVVDGSVSARFRQLKSRLQYAEVRGGDQ
jgi:F-type H+-transporting ATPase subunit delta